MSLAVEHPVRLVLMGGTDLSKSSKKGLPLAYSSLQWRLSGAWSSQIHFSNLKKCSDSKMNIDEYPRRGYISYKRVTQFGFSA